MSMARTAHSILTATLKPERLVMIPGGIGVTPIMSMLRTMADRGDKRPVILFYCNVNGKR